MYLRTSVLLGCGFPLDMSSVRWLVIAPNVKSRLRANVRKTSSSDVSDTCKTLNTSSYKPLKSKIFRTDMFLAYIVRRITCSRNYYATRVSTTAIFHIISHSIL